VAAGALWMRDERRQRLRRGLGALAGAIALATLFEYLSGRDLGLDQLLVPDPSPSLPGRMSPWTAATLALSAATLWFHRAGRLDRAADLALVGAGAALQLIYAGYLYGVLALYGLDPLTRVSPQTLLCLTLVWTALVGGRLGEGLLAVASRPSHGGATIRVLLPVAWVLPVAIGWVRLLAEWQGILTSTRLGVALFAVAQTLVLTALIYWYGLRLDSLEVRWLAERERREELERFVAICAWTGRVRSDGRWVRIEEYLAERWGIEVTHTISEEAAERLEAEAAAWSVAPDPASGRDR
jgi:hypothetical protein